jgi:YVTN family beta-propeller protein
MHERNLTVLDFGSEDTSYRVNTVAGRPQSHPALMRGTALNPVFNSSLIIHNLELFATPPQSPANPCRIRSRSPARSGINSVPIISGRAVGQSFPPQRHHNIRRDKLRSQRNSLSVFCTDILHSINFILQNNKKGNNMKNRAYYITAVLFLVAFVTTFNYGGCGGGGGGSSGSGGDGTTSGSSAPTQATSPNLSNGATDVVTSTQLSWVAVSGATSYDVYFGITTTGWASVTNTILTSFSPSVLQYSTTYYWRIDSKNSAGTTTGSIWSFTTTPPPPAQVTSPNPNDSATNVVTTTQISWASASDATSYDVYLGITTTGWASVTNTTGTSYNPGTLNYTTTYYWRIDPKNIGGTTTGNVWSFQTVAEPLAVDSYVWVANYDSNNVTRINKSNSSTTTITVGSWPLGVAVDGTYCWVANEKSNNVTRILKSNSAISTTIAVGSYPYGVAVDGTYCWVVNNGSNNVTRIKKSDLTTTTIAMGNSYSTGVAVDATYVWVANNDSYNVTRIKKSDLTTTAIAVGGYSTGVAVDGTYCWVANNSSDNVTRIKKSDLTTTAITVGNYPAGIAVDGTYCWVVNQDSNTVTRILKSDLTTTNITVGTTPISPGDMTGYAYDNMAP